MHVGLACDFLQPLSTVWKDTILVQTQTCIPEYPWNNQRMIVPYVLWCSFHPEYLSDIAVGMLSHFYKDINRSYELACWGKANNPHTWRIKLYNLYTEKKINVCLNGWYMYLHTRWMSRHNQGNSQPWKLMLTKLGNSLVSNGKE